jgi:hypothetical protein
MALRGACVEVLFKAVVRMVAGGEKIRGRFERPVLGGWK